MKKATTFFISLLFFLMATSKAYTFNEEHSIYAYAENLFSKKDFYRAITEYQRLLFYFPKTNFTGDASFKIAKSYQLGGKYNIAMDRFDEVIIRYPKKDIALFSRFERVECLYRMGDLVTALASYKMFLSEPKYSRLKELATYRIGYTQLKMRKSKEARASFKLIGDQSNLFKLSNEMIGKTEEFDRINRKTPLLAGIMSAIIPGSGQIYNGRIKDGIVALLTNGFFIWGTYELYRRKIYGVAAVASVFTLGWYSGNIFGAVNGAHKYNRKKESQFFDGLSSEYELLNWPNPIRFLHQK